MPASERPVRTSVARLLAVLAALVVLVPAAASALPIENFAGYHPQSTCSPRPKPGTLKLAAWLQKQYPGSGSLGISRSCKDGGVSEHKEGRAFDWAVSVHSARDRRYVRSFMGRLFATDKAGNQDALARRMGIMYLIWNDHIYSSSHHFTKRVYLNAGCKTRKKCSQTLRHRDHVHISLTRRGGMGLTSWYTKKAPTSAPKPAPAPKPVPAPKPAPAPAPKPAPTPEAKPAPKPAPRPIRHDGVLDLRSRPYVRLSVPTDGTVRETRFKVQAGRTYRLTAAGLYSYGSPLRVADAACVWSTQKSTWVPRPTAAVARRHGRLDLAVNGARLFGSDCRGSHVYRAVFTAKHTRTLSLRVGNRGETRGRLVFTISRRGTDVSTALPTYPTLAPAPARSAVAARGFGLVSETVPVPASATSVSTTTELQSGAQYRITVSGTAGLGGGAVSDGQCLAVEGSWYRQASLDRRFPDQDHGNLYVDGVPFTGDDPGCSSRTHATTWTADHDGKLALALWDPLGRSDDSGSLTVQVQRLTALTTPSAARAETPPRTLTGGWTLSTDRRLPVQASAPSGAVSNMRLRKGEQITLVANGTLTSGSVQADASCVHTPTGWQQRDPGVALEQDPLELWVDGQPANWRAMGRDGECSDEHGYIARFTATKNGPISLAVLDLDYRDNKGAFSVTLFRD